MPTLHVHLSPPASADRHGLAVHLATELTALTALHLGKQPALTAVLIHFMDPAHWFIGSRSLADSDQPGAQVCIAVTDDTNTARQMARWIEAVHALLRQVLPGLPETSYGVVQGVPASAWGYGGLTQEARRAVA